MAGGADVLRATAATSAVGRLAEVRADEEGVCYRGVSGHIESADPSSLLTLNGRHLWPQ